ncbi:Chitotriosidase-1 [Morella rubra]|uniref:Chitotriosidase-1 n=1 Tax=Morella rubra TaxID=262757 RepID=A0A6A1UHC2_9ROSI|nr:Chitotriosidase-1 [Morella rubra]
MTIPFVKAGYWSSTSQFAVGSIESSHFTHLFCAFAELNAETFEVSFPTPTMLDFKTFTQTVQRRNPDVRTLLSIGGPVSNPSIFASMASQAGGRKIFINSSIKLARTNNFHGLDLSWLYPSTADESRHLGELLKEWHDAIVDDAKGIGKPQLLLTAQVFYSPRRYSYPDAPIISHSLDWVNVLAYDFYSPSNSPNQTGAHSALRSKGEQPSVETGINAWIESGVEKTKLVLGLPFYGCAWLLADKNINEISSPAKGAPPSYPTGTIGYNQIKNFIARDQHTKVKFDTGTETHYCYDHTICISYDDTKSIIKKVEYAKEKELHGYFAWHVGYDSNWILSETAARGGV